jgi:hypothetical protein
MRRSWAFGAKEVTMLFSNSKKAKTYDDRSLNYYSDQLPDINPQLRHLDLERVIDTARDNLTVISAAVLLGGAVGSLVKRKFAVASCLVLGFVLQQTLTRRGMHKRELNGKDRNEIELERYALKAQRGDYGNLEVIAFK